MTARFQLVIDCADPEPLAGFWVAALGYEIEPPPDGYGNWDDYWLAVAVSEDELGLGLDRIVDPVGRGLRIWFQVVPEKKTLKNRLHRDITVSGGRANPIETRRRLVDAEAQRLEALGATLVRVICEDGVDHYGSPCGTLRATSSTSADACWLLFCAGCLHVGDGDSS
jgi:hypothetical protein